MDEEIAKNKEELEQMQKSWEQKVKDLQAQQNAEKVIRIDVVDLFEKLYSV